MSTVTVSVVIDEVDLKTLMGYFGADEPSIALSQALKWTAMTYRNDAAEGVAEVVEMKRPSQEDNDWIRKDKNELQHIAAYTFPNHVQERLEELLDKKREGIITEQEMKALDQLVLEVQLKTIEKAKAMAALKAHEETKT